MEIDTIKNQIKNIDACFHCMGVSAMRLGEESIPNSHLTLQKSWQICVLNLIRI